MADQTAATNEEARYWNEEGGQRWVDHMDHIEEMLSVFSTHLERNVAVQPGENVLDIGCGGGPTAAAYAHAAAPGGRVTGADISAPILAVARRRFGAIENLEFVEADAATHEFQAGFYDVLTSRYGVMFFPEPDAAFRNLARAVKPGGRVRLLVWRHIDHNPWMGVPARAAFTVLPQPDKAPPGAPGPFSLAERDHLHKLLAGAGLVDIHHEAVDRTVELGSVDNALDWLSRMGPAARALGNAAPDQRAAALDAMRIVLGDSAVDGEVSFAASAWLVSAVKPS